ncbi:MAG: hypothetical protein V5A72_01070, partial [Candidatus Nanohaloarchaea archaeon]
HYDSKDEILLDFMDQTLEKFTETCIKREKEDPVEELKDKAFIGFKTERKIVKALMEIRVQSIRDKRYKKKFEKFSVAYRETLENILREGKRKSVFIDDVNPAEISMFLDAVNNEAMFKEALGEDKEPLKQELEKFLENQVLL